MEDPVRNRRDAREMPVFIPHRREPQRFERPHRISAKSCQPLRLLAQIGFGEPVEIGRNARIGAILGTKGDKATGEAPRFALHHAVIGDYRGLFCGAT